MRVVVCLLFPFLIISGCSTMKGGGNSNVITLETCLKPSCETSFLIYSSKEEWVEQLVFESGEPLLNAGYFQNTVVVGRVRGIGYSSENPLLVFLPIGRKINKEGLDVGVVYSIPKKLQLKLISPPGLVIEPTR